MRRSAGVVLLVLLLVPACVNESDDPASASTTKPLLVPPERASKAVTSTSVEGAVYEWPEPDGPPQWTSIPLGLPGTTHVRVTHGPLGFLSINNVSRGAVVRISVDGSGWQETAILQGPGAEEQVSVADLLVTDREYLVVGETWTNTATGSERFQDVLWRSLDGVIWDALVLDRMAPGAKATGLVASSAGLIVAGATYDSEIGAASPRVWLEQPDGGFVELTDSIPGFDQSGWIEGVVVERDGLLAWGSTGEDTAFVWQTSDFQTWSRGVIDQGSAHIAGLVRLGERWVAMGGSSSWVSDDAVEWVRSAEPDDFATDVVSEGFAGFGRAYRQGEYVVAVATVGHRHGLAWCYDDPDDCIGSESTVLVTPNGREWRRIPLPGAQEQPDHPVEAHGFLVDGRLAVVHTVGSDAVLSILESVDDAIPLNSGEAPDLAFKVVGPGDQIEPGIRYGYAVWTHCGLPAIGPLNGVYWVVAPGSTQPIERVLGWGGYVFGFINLTHDNEIEYRVDDDLIARYVPDPAHRLTGCM